MRRCAVAQISLIPSDHFFVEKQTNKLTMPAMHYHHAFELYYLVKGEREYFIENKFFKVSAGDVVLIPKGMLHRTAGKGATRFLVYFSNDFLSTFFTPAATPFLHTGEPLVFRPDDTARAQLSLLFQTLLSEYQKTGGTPSAEQDGTLAGYLYQILFTISHAPNAYVPHSYTDDRIARVIQYINENYGQIGDIEQIASHFFISKFHLCRIFNKNLGIPLVTYLNTIRIREACRMMKAGNVNLTEIAMRCGFNSSSYFCKVFKSERGISPTQYKRQLRQSK